MERHYIYRRKDNTLGYHYCFEGPESKLLATDRQVTSMGKLLKKWDAPKDKRDAIYYILNEYEHKEKISLDEVDMHIMRILQNKSKK